MEESDSQNVVLEWDGPCTVRCKLPRRSPQWRMAVLLILLTVPCGGILVADLVSDYNRINELTSVRVILLTLTVIGISAAAMLAVPIRTTCTIDGNAVIRNYAGLSSNIVVRQDQAVAVAIHPAVSRRWATLYTRFGIAGYTLSAVSKSGDYTAIVFACPRQFVLALALQIARLWAIPINGLTEGESLDAIGDAQQHAEISRPQLPKDTKVRVDPAEGAVAITLPSFKPRRRDILLMANLWLGVPAVIAAMHTWPISLQAMSRVSPLGVLLFLLSVSRYLLPTLIEIELSVTPGHLEIQRRNRLTRLRSKTILPQDCIESIAIDYGGDADGAQRALIAKLNNQAGMKIVVLKNRDRHEMEYCEYLIRETLQLDERGEAGA